MRVGWAWLVVSVFVATPGFGAEPSAAPTLPDQIMPLFKARCVKCHGPAKREGKLSLATPKGVARGGEDGPVIAPGQLEESLLWERVAENEMPPKEPLPAAEKELLKRWIEGGAPGLPTVAPNEPEGADHWAFAPPGRPAIPAVHDETRIRNAIDGFIVSALEKRGLSLGPEADRPTLIRRVALDLTGLPPTPEEVARFRDDQGPDAYERMVERYLVSPHYGERWGKYWLDAAGYADSNGYFSADTDRPLAYRYRDYVIRAWNEDRPLDRFLQEQIAGDELEGFRPGGHVTPETIERLVATHFLRNAPDGTGESDGNPDELRADRYAVLEGATQILGSSLFGLTFQCARCHDHKFEPVTQRDYYGLYAILRPAFDLDRWVKPQERVVEAALPAERAAWEARSKRIDAEVAALRAEFRTWAERNRERGEVLYSDRFDSSEPLSARWSATAPGDGAPSGALNLDSETAPGAVMRDGALRIVESGAGQRWLSTRRAFDWTPDTKGAWVQATFDLVDTKLPAGGKPAERIGYYIALHDHDDKSKIAGGNILLDGNPAGGAAVHVDYPGNDAQHRGDIGSAGYAPGHSFGVRVTNLGSGQFRLEHLVDGVPEEKSVTLSERDLPDGGFGFEYCCGRSFIVDNVAIEAGKSPEPGKGKSSPREALQARRKALDKAVQAKEAERGQRPGRIAWVADLSATPSEMHLLKRGVYGDPGPTVAPAPPAVLADASNPFEVRPPAEGMPSTGRRLAFARWLTRPGLRPAALLARVTANRIWQQHFGAGLVATPENFGYSGSPPSHPELIEYLANELASSGWSVKALHRLILNSSTYRQASTPRAEALRIDPENRYLSRFAARRLDAEAIRDAMLAASGELDRRMGGPYIPVKPTGTGEIVVDESAPGAKRRSIYLQQRRTQILSLLDVFDAPSLVTNCTRRGASTIPLQSLSLLNSEFASARAGALAARLARVAGPGDDARIDHAFMLTLGRTPGADERSAARRFLDSQPSRYPGRADVRDRAWTDFCQMILASNAFLYLE